MVVHIKIIFLNSPKEQKFMEDRSGDCDSHKFFKMMRSLKNSSKITTVEFAKCAVAPSCCGQKNHLVSSSNEKNCIIRSWYSPFTVSLKKRKQTTQQCRTTYHMPIFSEGNSTSQKLHGLSLLGSLLSWLFK